MGYRALTPEEERVIVHRGTEAPWTGEYTETFDSGVYTCRRCGFPLYLSETKFQAHCGWPAFDKEIEGSVERLPDPDGMRTEIRCRSCGGHLGHVFTGEGYTETNTRHCVNSISMIFVPAGRVETAYFAGGCFWGVEHSFQQTEGVIDASSGYMGGAAENPSYREVCTGATGHAETVRVLFDSEKISFRELAMFFFEIHDPEQVNGQGVDIGTQYRSAVFWTTEEQRQITGELTDILRENGLQVATQVEPAGVFYPAEDYHQNYFDKNGVRGFCHGRVNRFQR
ncbi:peptide-methionine (S)-S-oxide reductase [Candidatus Fermentibacteria bacterium]|nr:MAG: peptide-methionine (S)-S-oxide reductase [Candidatus Fermentibacteria bacterium]